MGTFCYDNYEHPLLWCDEKKRIIERKNADESMRLWRRKKAEEVARNEKDKQEYYDMFIKHCPWGRPGGGAPNVDVRRRDITSIGLHSTPSISALHLNRSSSVLLPCRRYSNYFSPGKRRKCHGVTVTDIGNSASCETKKIAIVAASPLSGGGDKIHSTADGLQITLKDHPAMTFRNKGHVDIEVCYKALPKGKQALEKIVVSKNDECSAHDANRKSHREKANATQNWGKAGPGSKAWRSPKAIGSSFMRSLGWTNKEMLKELDQDNPATPAEKSTFKKRQSKKTEKCCALCTCTCPAKGCSPIKLPLSKKEEKSRFSRLAKKIETKVKLCPRVARHCTIASGAGGGMPDGGGVELVPLLARRRAEIRPISLSSTDVTKRTSSDNRWTNVDLQYLSELNNQMSQKRRSVSLSKQIEKDLCSKHFETFDTFWGRPGHGAPTDTKAKLKLDDLLYGVQSCTE